MLLPALSTMILSTRKDGYVFQGISSLLLRKPFREAQAGSVNATLALNFFRLGLH